MKRLASIGLTIALVAAVACTSTMAQQATGQQTTAPQTPPPSNYKKVSALVPLPDFVPGLGTLYVDPSTLPAGPFLAYDRQGRLVSSVYMIPIKDITAHKAFNDLAAAKEKVDHVDMYYNAGHPGVAEPHYHVVVWYISPQQAAALKQ
jgi:hypothetical protein